MLTEREKKNRLIYDTRPYEWLNASGGKDRACFWQEEMSSLMDCLGTDQKVLEIGCGPATDGKYLLESGCKEVVSVDYSAGMLQIAKEIQPPGAGKPDLCRMDAYHLAFPRQSFDGIWASALFVHLENPEVALEEIHRVLKPAGYGFISVKEGVGERIDERTGYYFRDYPESGPGNFPSYLSKAGFNVIESKVRPGYGRNWLTYLIRGKSVFSRNT